MKNLTTYSLRVMIHHPERKELKHEYHYYVHFFKDENGGGNQTVMQLATEDRQPFKYFDLSRNVMYDDNGQISFICLWADAYWSGQDGTWKLESVEVKPA